jgi:hypothetical protein
MSLSSIKEKRKLAQKLRRLPHLNRVFHEHRIGYEAARVVAGIATHETDAAWAERAVERTIKHLKEEVQAAGIVSRVEQREHVEPPDDALVADLRALEARVVTGAVFSEPIASQKCATETVAAIEAAFNAARHAPRHLLSRGRDTLRLRVEPEIRSAYRGLERLFERHRPLQMSFLRFACQALIDTHAHELPDPAIEVLVVVGFVRSNLHAQ